MNNILLIDKPSGMTSFDVIRKLRCELRIKKIGHAGTLDPLASGLLIIGLEKATKDLPKYMNLPKEYEVLAEFGKTSMTYDADGKIENGKEQVVSLEIFERLSQKFLGEIEQIPPAFSAIHVNGRRAYELARRGENVQLPLRKVVIKVIEILAWHWPLVKLRIRCGKGMYVRSLIHDMGQALGCGAYVKELRRTAIGRFRVEDSRLIS